MSTGIVTFPGINWVRRCRYTRTTGTVPDVVTLEVLPQSNNFASIGNLTMFHNGNSVLIANARVDRGAIRITDQGHVVGLRLLDRRWAWKFRTISGYYNQRNPDGTIRTETQRTPQQLATLLFQALGEYVFDVSLLPNATRPEVDWDYDDAARELSALASRLGCVVSLDLDNIARIYPVGYGPGLPNNSDVQSLGYGINPPEAPDQIACIGGHTRVQSRLELEAVGLDTDGQIKLVDDLSYVPVANSNILGLAGEGTNFAAVGEEFGKEAMSLARRTVWKWYRVKQQADGTQNIPGYLGNVEGIWQILPLRKVKIDSYSDAEGIYYPEPATVDGIYFDENIPGNTPAGTPIRGGFTLDVGRGIVKLEQHHFYMDGDPNVVGSSTKRLPAELYLETSYNVQHADTRLYERMERPLTLGNNGFGTEIIHRRDLVQLIVARYDDSTKTQVVNIENNIAAVNAEADLALLAASSKYQIGQSYNVQYRGIQPISTGGKIRQVTWEIDMQRGFRTWGYQNNESAIGVLTGAEKRRVESGRRLIDNPYQRKRRRRYD